MDQVRKIVDTIVDFIENYIKLIKDLVEKFKHLGDADDTTAAAE